MLRVTNARVCTLLFGAVTAVAWGRLPAQARSEASPAAAPVPGAAAARTYPSELIEIGRRRFAASCGFCHGRDAAGGAGGSDLTRSELVAADVGGERIGAAVRAGNAEAGMPAFPDLSASDLEAIVAFVHERNAAAAAATGGRRSVAAADLDTGNARAGARYFDANCTDCHSAEGDLAGIAARLEGLTLLRRMLYPGSERPGASARRPTVIVSTSDGSQVSGSLAHRDEFTIALTDADGRYRSWSTRSVEFEVLDPLEGHVSLLGRYTDSDIHDVYAFLLTLQQAIP